MDTVLLGDLLGRHNLDWQIRERISGNFGEGLQQIGGIRHSHEEGEVCVLQGRGALPQAHPECMRSQSAHEEENGCREGASTQECFEFEDSL
ncbi:hypothetical protein AB6A40_009260 [Gnathostoma spinigerum]|uniref:Uncharacterized protein n=1 Tax=Gnathostoma spinigerum TaxID=75299 RepID=A0ABD6ERR8_9BILA